MKFVKFLLFGFLFSCVQTNSVAAFVSATELGSWNWSGFNLNAANLTDEDVADMKKAGARVARFHLEATRCPTCSKYSADKDGLIRLQKIVNAAKKNNLKIIIVLDPAPRGSSADFWGNEERIQSLLDIWSDIASHYSSEDTIAAFDLLNEPQPPDSEGFNAKNTMWTELAQRIIKVIRAKARNQVLLMESSPIALPGAFAKLEPTSDTNVVYSFHFYEPHRLTHQGLLGFPIGLDYPGEVPNRGYWDKKRLSEYLDPVRQFVSRYHVPVQIGEFSFIRWAPNGARQRYLRDFLELVRIEGWGWLYHSYREWDGWDLEVVTNAPLDHKRSTQSPDFELIKSFLRN
ncbi:glycoside hydrolase family 5 protein [Ampullimonas aquatilis]|uniref:glycoside hydrolase family 5 protein n=1 Tax=Ampullimonas aquatilis TaxID=1341549 RepID=UPI003C77F4CE